MSSGGCFDFSLGIGDLFGAISSQMMCAACAAPRGGGVRAFTGPLEAVCAPVT